jgi:hypothetical protein
VLLTVLVWYTVVVPAPSASFVRRPGGGPLDAEERGDGPGPFAAGGETPPEDLDWPEYIGG